MATEHVPCSRGESSGIPGLAPLGDLQYPVAVTPEIETQLAAGAVVAIGVSGGKDSAAVAIRLAEYLDGIGHTGPCLLIHSDLGRVEWRDSLPTCERLARPGTSWHGGKPAGNQTCAATRPFPA